MTGQMADLAALARVSVSNRPESFSGAAVLPGVGLSIAPGHVHTAGREGRRTSKFQAGRRRRHAHREKPAGGWESPSVLYVAESSVRH